MRVKEHLSPLNSWHVVMLRRSSVSAPTLDDVVSVLGCTSQGCAPGVGVVNIDNGFGAARLAAAINRRVHHVRTRTTAPGSNQAIDAAARSHA